MVRSRKTIAECGVAFARQKPVVCRRMAWQRSPNVVSLIALLGPHAATKQRRGPAKPSVCGARTAPSFDSLRPRERSAIHPPLKTTPSGIRMGGRVVYRTALEMRSTATYREFESHPIRHRSPAMNRDKASGAQRAT